MQTDTSGKGNSPTCKAFALIDDDIRMCFCQCIGVDTSDTAWQQAQLSPSRGGLGFRSLSRHSPAAFTPLYAHLALVCIHLPT